MSGAIHLVKLIFAWGMAIAGTVCLFVAMPYVIPLFAGSIAYSLLPE